jgi:hypothetical protein
LDITNAFTELTNTSNMHVTNLAETHANYMATLITCQTELAASKAALAKATKNQKSTNLNQCKKAATHGNYCWTHGFFFSTTHTNATCNSKADGHSFL